MKKIPWLPLVIFILLLSYCKDKDNTNPSSDTGKLIFHFVHDYNSDPVVFDTLKYTNAAGNQLMFSEIQYFISDVTLHYDDGSTYTINKWKDIFYVDSDIPSTLTWNVYDSIPEGTCDSITFTFGIDEEKNKSFLYVNPPESLMFWPDILGGGYHYMKLNGKWLNQEHQLSPFNFHLGIGQIYDNEGFITGFIQNYFTVTLKEYPFTIDASEITELRIVMNIESWFDTPKTWDFNYWGGDIMQNQEAMHTACMNGHDVFTLDLPLYIQE